MRSIRDGTRSRAFPPMFRLPMFGWPAAAASLLLAPPAFAQPGEIGRPDHEEAEPLRMSDEALRARVVELVADLASSDVRTRVRATQELRGRHDLTLRHLEEALAAGGLNAEQRQRLTAAARERFFRGPRAAMGVQWTPDAANGAVILQATVEEFHSREVLLPRDRIESIAGMPVTEDRRLRAIIISHDPGESVDVELVRDGQPMKVQVRLGSYEDLRTVRPDTQALAIAWTLRLARIGVRPDGTLIEAGLSRQEWLNAATEAQERAIFGRAELRPGVPITRQRFGSGDEAEIVAAGEPRPSPGFSDGVARRAQQFQVRMIPEVQDALRADEARLRRQRLEVMRQARIILDEQIAAIDRVLDDPALAGAARELEKQQRSLLARRLADIDLQIRVLEDQDR